MSWQVQCYTLPDLFENYWAIERPYKEVFVKIDIESYECKLVPSFYEWLKDETYLPKMYISFHPKIESCTDEEYEGALQFFRLYDHASINDKEELDVENASIDDFKQMGDRGFTVVLYQDPKEELAVQQLAQPLLPQMKVDSGWAESGYALYVDRVRRLSRYVTEKDNEGVALMQWPHNVGEFRVLKEKGLYRNFWY